MSKKIRNIVVLILVAVWLALSVWAWVIPSAEMSDAERRPLAQFPELSIETVLEGKFSTSFESYTLDQFPLRDTWRTIKALFHTNILLQRDNNDIYIWGDSAAKMETEVNPDSVEYAKEHFTDIYNTYIKDTECKTYFSVIPDKHYYMADDSGHIAMDYQSIFDAFSNLEWCEYIELSKYMNENIYYRTDTHWAQENIVPLAQGLCLLMNTDVMPNDTEFGIGEISRPFYGVYYGQASLPIEPDTMYVLVSHFTEAATVKDLETNKTLPVYNPEDLDNKDLYDYFLGGAKAILVIDNPEAKTDRELILFRDSFGRSITPLMLESYKKITLIDTRYVHHSLIGNFVEFTNQDVLFLYSTSVLNNSFALK